MNGDAALAGDVSWPELKQLHIKVSERDAFGVWWCDGDFEDELPGSLVLDPEGHDEFVSDDDVELERKSPKVDKFEHLSEVASNMMAVCMPKVENFLLNYSKPSPNSKQKPR